MRGLCCILFSFFFSLVALAQTGVETNSGSLPEGVIQLKMKDIQWKTNVPNLPEGSRLAILEGDPTKEGMFTMRIELPPNTVIKPHTHPREERVTVMLGILYLGLGEKADTAGSTRFTVGSFYVNPPLSAHYLFTDKMQAILQITGFGPWEITYLEEKK